MEAQLSTTNLLLGIMAAASLLEALVFIGIGVGAFLAYRKVIFLLEGAVPRHLASTTARVNAILDDVKAVTETVKEETERVDSAVNAALHRIDDTAGRVRSTVRAKTGALAALFRGLRIGIDQVLKTRREAHHT
jgi:hypothetical protein